LTASVLRSGPRANRGLPVLVWRFDRPLATASTASAGGGVGLRRWVVNAQVPLAYARRDPDVHVDELAAELALPGAGVGMLTAADVASVRRVEEDGLSVEATVGLSHPVWAAADPEPAGDGPRVGTINVVALLPVRLSEAALLNALCTVTEAKSQALWAAGVAGTGTASDAVTLVCPPEGAAEPFGGPRSRWGGTLARAVCAAVGAGCAVPPRVRGSGS
jgi:adenosylcobinamide amidohydrolase